LLLDPIGVSVIARVDDDFSLSLVLADASDESVSCACFCASVFDFLDKPVSGLCNLLIGGIGLIGGLIPFPRFSSSVVAFVSRVTSVFKFSGFF
jgi:hypothetical protein